MLIDTANSISEKILILVVMMLVAGLISYFIVKSKTPMVKRNHNSHK